jgi:hypothetical protein
VLPLMVYTLSLYRVIPYGTNMRMNTRMSTVILCEKEGCRLR